MRVGKRARVVSWVWLWGAQRRNLQPTGKVGGGTRFWGATVGSEAAAAAAPWMRRTRLKASPACRGNACALVTPTADWKKLSDGIVRRTSRSICLRTSVSLKYACH